MVSLHDDLLIVRDQRGRFWNGVGSILATLLCITGAIVWWPGIASWRRAISIRGKSSWKRFNFDTHSALGFWFFSIIAIWSISGIYLSMPSAFMDVVNWFFGPQPEDIQSVRLIDRVMEWMVRLHFGRWRSHTLKVVWVIIGLIPAIMFVTGFIMWWNRVVKKPRTARVRQRQPVLATLQQEPQGVE